MTIFEKALTASRELHKVVPNKINRILNEIADEAIEQADDIIAANALDLAALPAADPRYGQIELNRQRIEEVADEIRDIATLPSPLGKILSSTKRPNEMVINKVTTPFGVIGIICEWQPTILMDSFALCFKSGNALVLNCDTASQHTNEAVFKIIKAVLEDNGVNPDSISLMSGDHKSATRILHAVGHVDLVIPRGSKALNEFARENTKVPIITTLTGVCHTYIDKDACIDKATTIVFNAKSRRPQACNSLDCLIIDRSYIENIEQICQPLIAKHTTIYADKESYSALENRYPHLEKATEEHFSTEFRGDKMAIKTVSNIDNALAHISIHSAKHSEAIVTENCDTAKRFTTEVDAACVYHNVSTAFTDGTQFGMGAEIGISTQKLGARGPMALSELTTYKYIVTGDSQIR